MKRAVFISVLCLFGVQSPSNSNPYFTSVTHCNVLCVPKGISNTKLSTSGRSKYKDQDPLGPLNSKYQNLPIASIKASATLLPEEPPIKLALRLLHKRRKTGKYTLSLSSHFNNDISVPP
jgi:hypothetical protein